MTMLLWLCATSISILLGLLSGTIRCLPLRIPILSPCLDVITVVLRGVPLYAQLMIMYFILPGAFGIQLSSFTTGVLTLGLCSGAYASEIIRSGYNGIDRKQWHVAQVLGYSRWQQLRYIIAPQMITHALPGLINEYVMTLKSTALLATIGTVELTKIGTNMMYRTYNPIGISLMTAALYLGMTTILTTLGIYLERNFNAQR